MHIGGHRRRAAAILNQTKTLKCLVEDIPPEETHHEAVLDNLHKEMDWWDWDVLIAIEHEDNPNMNQRDLADWVQLKKSALPRPLNGFGARCNPAGPGKPRPKGSRPGTRARIIL